MEISGHRDSGPIVDGPERADDVAVAGKLEGGGEVSRLVRLLLIRFGRAASGQVRQLA
jgi:hypothetical protein